MKVAICIPVYGDTRAGFTLCLARLITHTLSVQPAPQVETFVVRNSLRPGREELVGQARGWGADFILWMDSDHVFPPDSLIRLLSLGLDVVGCNYARRGAPSDPNSPTAVGIDGNLIWTTPEKVKAGEIEEVRGMGLGVCLMSMTALDRLPRPIFRTTREQSEDTCLFLDLATVGVKAYADHLLSWHVGHIDEQIRENIHTIADRARFRLKSKTA